MNFRFVPLQAFSAAMNMALDEAICEMVKDGSIPPTIRIYTWEPSAISIGYFQGLHNEVDIDACKDQKVDIVRRRTGGGAVYHDREGEITYSLIAPESWFPKNIVESYEQICNALIDALQEVGIKASFNPINDLISGEQKISGNAQTRRHGILLQHGTILYKVDVDTMFSLLKVGKEKIADKLIQSVKKRVTSIHDQKPQVTQEEVAQALRKGFSNYYELEDGEYSQEELKRAEELVKERYATQEWNGMR